MKRNYYKSVKQHLKVDTDMYDEVINFYKFSVTRRMDKYIKAPISNEDAALLKAGDYVYITGTIYTARDAAH